jgi:hypothetical protein
MLRTKRLLPVLATCLATSLCLFVTVGTSRADWQQGSLEVEGTPVEDHPSTGDASATAEANVANLPIQLGGQAFGQAVTSSNATFMSDAAYGHALATIQSVCTWNTIGPPSTITWDDNWQWGQSVTENGQSYVTFGGTSLYSASGTLSNLGSASTSNFTFTISGTVESESFTGDLIDAWLNDNVWFGTAHATATRYFVVN